jgi:anion-transporting  ArsA/GET3 family ATPase
VLERLLDRQIIFVTGKGGVGKSTVVSALGRALARRGRRTLVAELDAYSAMEALLDVDLSGSEITSVADNLEALNLEASEAFVEAIRQFLPSDRLVRTLVNNRIARVFFDAAPGVNEFALLNSIDRISRGQRSDTDNYDHIIVDLPASGHAVTFLGVPQTMGGITRSGPVADMAERLTEMVQSEARSAMVAVCLPEEMPVNETVELDGRLDDEIGRRLTAVFANMVHRPPLSERYRGVFADWLDGIGRRALLEQALEDPTKSQLAAQRVIAANMLAHDWHQRDARHLKSLHSQIDAPIAHLPVVYDTDGGVIANRVAELIADGEVVAEAPPQAMVGSTS